MFSIWTHYKKVDMQDLLKYKKYATVKESERLDALVSEGSYAKAAKKLGIAKSTLFESVSRLKGRSARQGFAPDVGLDKPAPPSFEISSLRFNSKGEWSPAYAKVAKSEASSDVLDVLEARCAEFKKAPAVKLPKITEDELLNLYTLTDGHLGMLCWAAETGDSWNIDKSVNRLGTGFANMIERSPKAKYCIINQLGDFIHTDSMLPVTPKSGHVLDVDSRYYKMVDVGFTLLRQIVDLALKKHESVILLCAEGNHDESAPPWLQTAFHHIYEKEPRLTVIRDPKPYYSQTFGKNLLCFHHGHKQRKPSDLNKIFSSDPFFRKDWGEAKYAYGHSGHLHHERVEDGGCLWTQHPTLAARNAYEARLGYSSQRACIAFTYHKEFGEYCSHYVRPEMFED